MRIKNLLIISLILFVVAWGWGAAAYFAVNYAFGLMAPTHLPMTWRSAAAESWPYGLGLAVVGPIMLWTADRKQIRKKHKAERTRQ